jgi:hypothetical protein
MSTDEEQYAAFEPAQTFIPGPPQLHQNTGRMLDVLPLGAAHADKERTFWGRNV